MRHSLLSLVLIVSACGDDGSAPPDSAVDASADGSIDSSLDASLDARVDSSTPPRLGRGPIAVSAQLVCYVGVGDRLECWGIETSRAEVADAVGESTVGAVAVGARFSDVWGCAVISPNGELRCWGQDVLGRVSDAPTGSGFVNVSVAASTACVLSSDGVVSCWGGDRGGLGFADDTSVADETPSDRLSTISVSDRVACGLRLTDGSPICWGSSAASVPTESFSDLVTDGSHACALATDTRRPECWRLSTFAEELTVPDTELATLSVGEDGFCGTRVSGGVVCWPAPTPVTCDQDTLAEPSWISIAGGPSFGCGVDGDGEIRCWGVDALLPPGTSVGSSGGELTVDPFDGETRTGFAISGDEYLDLAVGLQHACGVRTDGSIRCWGVDDAGQCSGAPAGSGFIDIGVGDEHSCALHEDGAVQCWGRNEVPPGATESPVTPPSDAFRAIESLKDGNCGLRAADDTAVCWGSQGDPITRPEDIPAVGFESITLGGYQVCGVETGTHHLACWRFGGYRNLPPEDTEFAMVSAADELACGLERETGSVLCWGAPRGGAVNQDGVPAYDEIDVFGSVCALRRDDGGVECWSDFLEPVASRTVIRDEITAMSFHSLRRAFGVNCAIRQSDGRAVCWGRTRDTLRCMID